MLSKYKLDRGYWYLATPYSKYPAGIEAAFRDASAAAGKLLAEGVHVYCPIAHTHPLAEYGGLDHFSHDIFMPLDEQMMEHAHGCLILQMPGWADSKGIEMEMKFFAAKERPVHFIKWPLSHPSTTQGGSAT